MAQLCLEIAQFLLEAGQCRQDDGLGAQRTAGLHVVIKPFWLPIGVIGSLSILVIDLRVLTLGPGIREQDRLAQSPCSSLAPQSPGTQFGPREQALGLTSSTQQGGYQTSSYRKELSLTLLFLAPH